MWLALNKPFDVLSQFTDGHGRSTLAAFVDAPGIYPVGRLDRDSEGLLLLSDEGRLMQAVMSRATVAKTYVVQVEGVATESALAKLRLGVELRDGPARALSANAIQEPAWLWPRTPPIRHRQTIPTAWIEMQIDEGRNRQVRRMTAAVGLPTLRLIRTAIGPVRLGTLTSGSHRPLSVIEYRALRALLRDSRRGQ
jgi:23S rRNA pseudouridine2457 synthase